MAVVHLVDVFCVPAITGVPSVMARLVHVETVKWVLMGTAASCVPTMFRDPSAFSVNLDTGGCQRTAAEVRVQSNMFESLWLVSLNTVLDRLTFVLVKP